MTENKIKYDYFEWMIGLVSSKGRFRHRSYQKLLTRLHLLDFTYLIDKDGNREADGIDLRYRFGCVCAYSDSSIASYLDDKPCSVLEMMIALALRCEENIMDDPEFGNRTGEWFWSMIGNLGLLSMTDERYDRSYIDTVVRRFLNREYHPNGHGGLFVIHNLDRDLRNVEIWYQMCWFLDAYLNEMKEDEIECDD